MENSAKRLTHKGKSIEYTRYEACHFFGHERMARQAKFRLCNALCNGQVEAVPCREATLLMGWNGVVNVGFYAVFSKIAL